MAKVYILQAAPLLPIGTSAVAIRLAGGGQRPYAGYKGFSDWRAGLFNAPRFTNAIGFDQGGPTGGAIPTVGVIVFGSTDQALLATLASYYWKGSRITLESGDDAAGPVSVWKTEISGTVAGISFDSGFVKITVSDLSGDLAVPIAPGAFGGTGGIDGGAEANSRVKRIGYGRIFNIEGQILDQANNIYEFGDPATPIQEFTAVRDKGVIGATTTLADQGTPAATFLALQGATVIAGGAVVAPSIRCAKWWTQPSGPLTADIKGEATGGYVEYASAVVGKILATYAPAITFANAVAFDAACHRVIGQLADDGTETVAAFLDRLLSPLGFTWALDAAGNFNVRKFTFSSPVATVRSNSVQRIAVFQPLRRRSVGYQANNRKQSAGEIAASITDDSANAWTPVLVNFVQQGASFVSTAFTTDFDNSVRSAEAWPQARASLIVNAVGDAFNLALIDPAMSEYWGAQVTAAGDYKFNRNGDTSFDTGVNAAVGDVLEIGHTGTEISFLVNGKDVGTAIATGIDPSRAFQLFANVRRPNEIVRSPTFSRSGAGGVGSVTLKNRSNMSIVGNVATKVAGASAFGNASFYSAESYYGAYLAYTVAQAATVAYVGFRSVGTTYAGFSSLGYAWHHDATGTAYCRYGGADHESTSYAVGDVLQIIDDLANVSFLKNGALIATAVSNAVGRYLDSDVSTLGNRFENITFGPAGSSAGSGANTATITLYKRATSTPTLPTTTGTYTFSTASIAFSGGGANGWTQAVPAGTDPLYTTAATAFASGTTDTIATSEWASPILFSQNQVVAPIFLYRRSATTPALPTGTASYTVATSSLTFPSGGANSWTPTIPAADGNPLWITTATVVTALATDTIANTEWATPQILAQDGLPGYNSATINIYRRSATSPALPTATTTYTFSTGGLTGLNNSWTRAIPAADGNPLWVSAASAAATGATDTIAAGEWATPVVLAQDGDAATAATVFIFQRAASAPALPSATATYTFATGAISGLNNGWSRTIPAGSNPVYVAQATALATGTTDTITSGEWSTPAILAQNGATGGDGTDGVGTTPINVVGGVSWDGVTITDFNNAGNFTSHGAYGVPIAGGASLSFKALDPFGNPTDFFCGLRSAPSASFNFSSYDIVAIRFAAQSTSLGSSTSYHTEVWVNSTAVALDKPWNSSYTYTIRYDAASGMAVVSYTAVGGSPVTMWSGNVGAGKAAGLQLCFGNRGQIAALAFGAAGANGQSGSGNLAAVAAGSAQGSGGVNGSPSVVAPGATVTVHADIHGEWFGSGAGSNYTCQLQYSTNNGGSWTAFGNVAGMSVGSGAPSDDTTCDGTFTNGGGNQSIIFRVNVVQTGSSNNSWSSTLWAR